MNDGDRRPAPLPLVRNDETDCPVCGLGGAFAKAKNYDFCARCEWIDDPAAYRDPKSRSDTNDHSLREAQLSWPKRLVLRLAAAPLSTFGITMDDAIGGFDFRADGVSLRELFPTGAGI